MFFRYRFLNNMPARGVTSSMSALKVIEKQSRFKNANILFVTDGDAGLSDEFMTKYLQLKKSVEFQCMGCVLDGNLEYQPVLEKFTDEWFAADDLVEAAEKS